MDQEFQLILPSNSSPDTFPNNQMHDFTVKLPISYDLRGYSVALTELQYPVTWYDVGEDVYLVLGMVTSPKSRLVIPPGKYRTIEAVVDYIKDVLFVDVRDVYSVEYDPIRLKVTFNIYRESFIIELSDKLAVLLGFHEKKRFVSDDPIHSTFVSDSQADIDSGMTALYVYSNIVQNQVVGHTFAPILRHVHINKRKGANYQSIEFRKDYYVPCVQETTDLITINIRRDTGEFVAFKLGKVVVTLHFKKTS